MRIDRNEMIILLAAAAFLRKRLFSFRDLKPALLAFQPSLCKQLSAPGGPGQARPWIVERIASLIRKGLVERIPPYWQLTPQGLATVAAVAAQN